MSSETVPAVRTGVARSAARNKKQPLYFQREISWLDFNGRVLDEARNPVHPLLERLKFLAIFSNNLDEFFMIHIPGIRERADEESGKRLTADAMRERVRDIQRKLIPMLEERAKIYKDLMARLAEHGIKIHPFNSLDRAQKAKMERYFATEVFPVLTPLAVGPGHPFPYISNLSISLAVIIHDPKTKKEEFARVKVPTHPVLPRFVPIEDGKHEYVLMEDLVSAHLGNLFPGMVIRSSYPFRITRNADLDLHDEEGEDLMGMIEQQLQRRRFGEIERVEIHRSMPHHVRKTLFEEMEDASPEEVYETETPLHLADFFAIAGLDMPELRDAPFQPGIPATLRDNKDMFAAIRQGDILLHHPFQSFDCVSEFLRRAAADPDVLTIKHTLYRTSGDSPILQALTDAADNGKQVACLVELKARFDEANNITWAKQLEKSGVHVVYGWLGLKTHCKIILVIRREEDGLRRYLHIGTGNYNARTAKAYTDVGVLTCSPDFGADATDLFNYLTGYSRQTAYRKFQVAPVTLRRGIEGLIEREMNASTPAKPGRIIAKMNALVDPRIIQALYRASQKGVQIDLIIRGMCCLRPGVPGLSENIRVMSIVGRFLEHSRIFYFQNDGAGEVYIGSADWMTRNLDRRIEVVVPIEDASIRESLLHDVLEAALRDNCQAWDLNQDGAYTRRAPAKGETRFSVQERLLETLA